MIIGWEDNLSSDEMPPKWMWPLSWDLTAHMERVTRKRKEKYESGKPTDHDDSGEAWEASEEDVQAWIAENAGT